MKIRVKFSKHGAVRFVGHLDIMRYFQKAIRRSELPAIYSEGFSPHQKLSFAQPLAVGLESKGEYFDLEVSSAISSESIKDALNAQMVAGIEILDVVLLDEKSGNAMASVEAASYLIRFSNGCEPSFIWQDAFLKFMELSSIQIIKETKKSTITIDLKPFIFQYEVIDASIFLTLNASSAGNIKPMLVIKAFYDHLNRTLGAYDLQIERLDTYGKEETTSGVHLVPLSYFGEHF